MPPKKTKKKSEVVESVTVPIETFLVTDNKNSTSPSHSNKSSLSKSKSKKRDLDENGFPIIKLIFQENLLKSLNKIYERQNHELLKIISIDKTIPLNDLLNFMDDQSSVFIKEIEST